MKCQICGKEIEKSLYSNGVLCSQECYSADFWNRTLDENAIIINGVCYHDGGRRSEGYRGFLGHGGKEFTILMTDGRIISTNNLWCNGDLPETHKRPDNAKFIEVM